MCKRSKRYELLCCSDLCSVAGSMMSGAICWHCFKFPSLFTTLAIILPNASLHCPQKCLHTNNILTSLPFVPVLQHNSVLNSQALQHEVGIRILPLVSLSSSDAEVCGKVSLAKPTTGSLAEQLIVAEQPPRIVVRILSPSQLACLSPDALAALTARLVPLRTAYPASSSFHQQQQGQQQQQQQQAAPFKHSSLTSIHPTPIESAVAEAIQWAAGTDSMQVSSSASYSAPAHRPTPPLPCTLPPWLFLQPVSANMPVCNALRMEGSMEQCAAVLVSICEQDRSFSEALANLAAAIVSPEDSSSVFCAATVCIPCRSHQMQGELSLCLASKEILKAYHQLLHGTTHSEPSRLALH